MQKVQLIQFLDIYHIKNEYDLVVIDSENESSDNIFKCLFQSK